MGKPASPYAAALPPKGTVTPLSSIFPAEQSIMASKRVHDTIVDRQRELEKLEEFIADNNNLINLVQKLPDELHHDVMVPFGKVAFFPGRLIHTNEFMVLLGEGYYAERTSKQTVEILKRRGKGLESQVDSLKAMMLDLKAEASFFDATAVEAAEGFVEITEEYIEPSSTDSVLNTGHQQADSYSSETGNEKVADDDREYARMMARLDELEREERAAESQLSEDEEPESDFSDLLSQRLRDHSFESLEDDQSRNLMPNLKEDSTIKPDIADRSSSKGVDARHVSEDELSLQKGSAHHENKATALGKASKLPGEKKNAQAVSTSKDEAFTGSILERPIDNAREKTSAQAFTGSILERPIDNAREKTSAQIAKAGTSSSKAFTGSILERPIDNAREKTSAQAFTGSILEHTHNLQTSPGQQDTNQSSGSRPSKPISKFKMLRR